MTDAFTSSNADVRDEEDTHTARLDRQADALLAGAEGRAFGTADRPALDRPVRPSGTTARPSVASVRQAVRDDVQHGRDIARYRAERARDAIRDEPVRAALYAVGAGVLIGLLLRR
ncbi:hypothetical protein BH10PSE2_BH10PSE2_09320 [soil metagenome]